VRRNDLHALRSELEGTFSHGLAIALYELMSASNARLARTEDLINQRVQEAVERQTVRLAATLDAHHQAASEMTEVVWREIDSLRQRFVGPIDGLAAFQRELRHEVGRLGDLVLSHAPETAQQTAAASQQRDDHRRMKSGNLGDIVEAMAAMKDDLGALRAEVAELRAAVEGTEQSGRTSRWRRRNR
jgi:triphosphoribosyl-dephospho-CoA synthetase